MGRVLHHMGHPEVSKTAGKLVNQICSLGWNDRMVWNGSGNSARLRLVPLLFDICFQLILSIKKLHVNAGACPVSGSYKCSSKKSPNLKKSRIFFNRYVILSTTEPTVRLAVLWHSAVCTVLFCVCIFQYIFSILTFSIYSMEGGKLYCKYRDYGIQTEGQFIIKAKQALRI